MGKINIGALSAALNKNERSGSPVANDIIEQIIATYETARTDSNADQLAKAVDEFFNVEVWCNGDATEGMRILSDAEVKVKRALKNYLSTKEASK